VLKRFTPIITVVALCWVVFLINNLLWGGQLSHYGVIPRRAGGLPGILWAPFLHGSFKHLLANTAPLLILGGIICARSKSECSAVMAAGILLSGGLTWLCARTASHIGASGLVFCLFGYLASLAYFRRTMGTLLLSALCILGYGGMLRGILPGSTTISWESHVAGLVAGIACAWAAARIAPRSRKNLSTTAPEAPRAIDQIR